MVRETYSEQETFELGKEIGEHAKGGEVFTLEGDLGVGKTVFTKGFAYGLGVRDDVVSPTFTIVQEYEDGRLPFYHFDVYRICLLYTSPSPRDTERSRMPSSA